MHAHAGRRGECRGAGRRWREGQRKDAGLGRRAVRSDACPVVERVHLWRVPAQLIAHEQHEPREAAVGADGRRRGRRREPARAARGAVAQTHDDAARHGSFGGFGGGFAGLSGVSDTQCNQMQHARVGGWDKASSVPRRLGTS